MRLLVLGANGLLGSNVLRAGLTRDWDVRGTYHSTAPELDVPTAQLDLGDREALEETLADQEPDVVINCAAMTDVDRCETDPDGARRINAEAPRTLARLSASAGATVVHVSTDYVFDGRTDEPYDEAAEPNPLQIYGESKLAGERAVLEHAPEALVPRLSFVWGIHRGTDELVGFPAWVRSQLSAGEEVPLFTDQRVTPTRAGQAASVLLDLVAISADGVVNVAARSCVTPYEFGRILAQHLGFDTGLLRESSMAAVDRDATRPASTCLDVERVESLRQEPQPTLREDVMAALPAEDRG